MHTRIVGRNNDKPAVRTCVGKNHEGIGGHVEPHMFHGDKYAQSSNRCAHAFLKGHFLVRRPTRVRLWETSRQGLDYPAGY